MVDNMASNLFYDIQALTYRGESINGTFEKCEAMHVAFHNKGQGLVAFEFNIIDERILIDAFTAGITDPDLYVVKANVIARPKLVGDFYAVAKCYGDYIKTMPKTHNISEVETHDNYGDDGHQCDGGGNRRGGRGGGSQTGRGGGGNNRGKKPSRKDIGN